MIEDTIICIKRTIETLSPGSEVVLFGSRARKESTPDSDYDLMVIVPQSLALREKISLSCAITASLARLDIQADVLVETKDDIVDKSELKGTVVREALREGLRL